MKLKKVVLLGIGMAATMCFSACGSDEVDVEKVSMKDIQKANHGEELLANHDSVSYKMETRDEKGKFMEEAYLYEEDDKVRYLLEVSEGEDYMNMLLKDGYIYTELSNSAGVHYDVCWLMGKQYDNYVDENIRAFLIDEVDGLEIKKREESEDYISVTALVDAGDNAMEDYDMYYEYVMNKETLEVNQFVSYGMGSDKKKDIGSFAQISYDEEVEEPDFVSDLEDSEKKRTITLVIDDGKSTKEEVLKTASTASFDLILEDGYEVYTDKECTKTYSVDNDMPAGTKGYQDMTLYIKKQ